MEALITYNFFYSHIVGLILLPIPPHLLLIRHSCFIDQTQFLLSTTSCSTSLAMYSFCCLGFVDNGVTYVQDIATSGTRMLWLNYLDFLL
jgi:hypothetical protein